MRQVGKKRFRKIERKSSSFVYVIQERETIVLINHIKMKMETTGLRSRVTTLGI